MSSKCMIKYRDTNYVIYTEAQLRFAYICDESEEVHQLIAHRQKLHTGF